MSKREIAPPVLAGGMLPEQLVTFASSPASHQPRETGAKVVTPGLSLRLNFAWILTGNLVYAICQWGAIVALAKLGSSFVVGQFSLGLAIATPVLMFTNLQLRAVQATDARRLYSFGEYLRLRIALTLIGLLVIAGIACFGNYQRQTAMVILAVAMVKAVETLSDIHYGLFQLNDRLDQTGKSMVIRGVLLVIALSTGLYVTRNILLSCGGVVLVWLSALLFFDVRRGLRFIRGCAKSADNVQLRRPWHLLRIALPLGIATSLAALNLNMPRYFIHARLGERQLGIYSAMAYTTVAMVLVSDSLGHCAIPRLSRLYSTERMADYRSLLLRLVAAGSVLGVAGVAVARFLGRRLLTLLYGSEYAAHYQVFQVLILAAAIYCVACMLTSAVTAARRFGIQVPLYALVVGSNALACARWVPVAGLAGGAKAMVVGATVQFVLGAAVVAGLLRSKTKLPAQVQTPRSWENDCEATL